MVDFEFDDFLNLNQETHEPFDHTSARTLIQSYSGVSSFDDIEHIYTVLHQSIDQVLAQIDICAPSRLDRVREQNRKLIDRLTTLDSAIRGGATAVHAIPDRVSPISVPVLSPDVNLVRDREKTTGTKITRSKRKRVLQSKGQAAGCLSAPTSSVLNVAQIQTVSPQDQVDGTKNLSFGDLPADSRLANKLLQIGNEETKGQIATFAMQMKAPQQQNALPNMCSFPEASVITDVAQFLRLVLDLGSAIESSVFGEQNSRIRKRIALAHFFHAYTLAQENSKTFLAWCDNQQVQGGWMLPKGGNKSIVQQRFADLIFSRSEIQGRTASPSGPLDNGDDINHRRTAKIQMWRKSGKKWAQIIQRFGYGILLLLPSSLSDEELRVARNDVVESGLDLVDSRRHLFADVLQQANALLDAHFFPQVGTAHLTKTNSSSRSGWTDWDDLLNLPLSGN